eukprot:g4418.t1
MLGGMLTSCANLRSLEPECLGAYADALMGLEEWRRASALYDRAEVAAHSLRRAAMKGASRASRGGAGGSGAAGAAAAELTPFHLVGSWKLGRARCLAKLGEERQAIAVLEPMEDECWLDLMAAVRGDGIRRAGDGGDEDAAEAVEAAEAAEAGRAQAVRVLRAVYLLKGKLNRDRGATMAAEQAYLAAIEVDPYALEAIKAVIHLSSRANSQLSQLIFSGDRVPDKDKAWLQQFVEAHSCEQKHQLKRA